MTKSKNRFPAGHLGSMEKVSEKNTIFDLVNRFSIPEIKEGLLMDDPTHVARLLDINGKLIDSSYADILTKEELLKAYSFMVLSRQQDVYMTQLQRQGRMLNFAANFGEEALQVAAATALRSGDWFIPAFRSNAAMLMGGVTVEQQLLYWNGQERGNQFERSAEGITVTPINIPIGTNYSHAAGVGYALKSQGKKNVALVFIGNGGTAEGEFYEAMNFAAIWKWPVIFCVNDNQWAISTANTHESNSVTIAAKAKAVGIPSYMVDGNDLLASYEVTRRAREWAVAGNGPVLIHFVTWRQGPHTSPDNPKLYRTEEGEKMNERWEPMHRIENFLKSKGYIDDAAIKKLWEDSLEKVKQAYQSSLTKLDSTPEEIFDYTFEENPDYLKRQFEELKQYQAWKQKKERE